MLTEKISNIEGHRIRSEYMDGKTQCQKMTVLPKIILKASRIFKIYGIVQLGKLIQKLYTEAPRISKTV